MEVDRNDGMLKIRSTLTSISKVGPMTLVSFDVDVITGDGRKVLDLKTQFGFFPPSSLVRQAAFRRSRISRKPSIFVLQQRKSTCRSPRLTAV